MSENNSASDAWARDLLKDRAWVLHMPTRTVGQVVQHYTADKPFTSLVNGKPVLTGVLELHQGHTFVASDPDDYLRLTEAELKYFEAAEKGLKHLVTELAKLGAATRVPHKHAVELICSALETQAGLLRAP